LKKDYGNYYTKLLKEILFSFVPIDQTDDIFALPLFYFPKSIAIHNFIAIFPLISTKERHANILIQHSV